jgi:hypothetical protein
MKSAVENDDSIGSRSVITYIQQSNSLIQNIESPFSIQESIIIPNCVYMFFSGEEHEFLYLFFKMISVIGYENMLPSKETYTFFLSQNDDDNIIAAEIYTPLTGRFNHL